MAFKVESLKTFLYLFNRKLTFKMIEFLNRIFVKFGGNDHFNI